MLLHFFLNFFSTVTTENNTAGDSFMVNYIINDSGYTEQSYDRFNTCSHCPGTPKQPSHGKLQHPKTPMWFCSTSLRRAGCCPATNRAHRRADFEEPRQLRTGAVTPSQVCFHSETPQRGSKREPSAVSGRLQQQAHPKPPIYTPQAHSTYSFKNLIIHS